MLRPWLHSGTRSAGATCTNNVATGYFFDATEIVLAGENATTTQCPPGTAGFATRQCLWNGANSSTGVWAEPLNNCKRMPGGADTPHALLGWLLIAGVLLFAWPGGLQRLRAPPWRGSTPRLRPSTSAASRVHARLASRAPSRASACTTRRPARPTGGARPILRRASVRMPRTLTYPLEGCGLTMAAAAFACSGAQSSHHLRKRGVQLCQLARVYPERPEHRRGGPVLGRLRAKRPDAGRTQAYLPGHWRLPLGHH